MELELRMGADVGTLAPVRSLTTHFAGGELAETKLAEKVRRHPKRSLPAERHTRSRAELGLGLAVHQTFHCIEEALV